MKKSRMREEKLAERREVRCRWNRGGVVLKNLQPLHSRTFRCSLVYVLYRRRLQAIACPLPRAEEVVGKFADLANPWVCTGGPAEGKKADVA